MFEKKTNELFILVIQGIFILHEPYCFSEVEESENH